MAGSSQIQPHAATAETATNHSEQREAIFDVFRRWGYMQSWLDPLGQYLPPEPFPVPMPTGPIADEAREFYSKTFGIEFMHIASQAQRQWLAEQVEQPARYPDQPHVLSLLIRADIFEQTIQSRYLGTKRFSLEGLTVLIPFLDEVLRVSYLAGVTRALIAMSHRGRLNVMTNIIGRAPAEIFAEFEDVDPRSVLGGGDVKYHIGATGEYQAEDGGAIELHLVSNPSHLEAVDPVLLGRARARQARLGEDGAQRVLPIMVHGDAAFAGQGIVAESLVLGSLPGYDVGGTVHVIVNNLLGFTALPEEGNASRYSSDLAKRLPIPIFHVNAEDPDAVVRVAAIAAEFRHRFHSDVLVDLIGYRRHGHSEVDDPTVTQPLRYAKIKDRPCLYQLYAEQMRVDPAKEVGQVREEFLSDQKTASLARKKPRLAQMPSYWSAYKGGPFLAEYDVLTGLAPDRIADLCQRMTREPEGFHVHPC
jgi:2-oxoglutarate dehydrogenase E1 component